MGESDGRRRRDLCLESNPEPRRRERAGFFRKARRKKERAGSFARRASEKRNPQGTTRKEVWGDSSGLRLCPLQQSPCAHGHSRGRHTIFLAACCCLKAPRGSSFLRKGGKREGGRRRCSSDLRGSWTGSRGERAREETATKEARIEGEDPMQVRAGGVAASQGRVRFEVEEDSSVLSCQGRRRRKSRTEKTRDSACRPHQSKTHNSSCVSRLESKRELFLR